MGGGELLLLRRLLSTGSDVVFCSFPPSPRAASSIAIVLSTPDCIVSEHQGCVHVAAVRDCAADALVYAAFVAYCHAASGMRPPSLLAPWLHCKPPQSPPSWRSTTFARKWRLQGGTLPRTSCVWAAACCRARRCMTSRRRGAEADIIVNLDVSVRT